MFRYPYVFDVPTRVQTPTNTKKNWQKCKFYTRRPRAMHFCQPFVLFLLAIVTARSYIFFKHQTSSISHQSKRQFYIRCSNCATILRIPRMILHAQSKRPKDMHSLANINIYMFVCSVWEPQFFRSTFWCVNIFIYSRIRVFFVCVKRVGRHDGRLNKCNFKRPTYLETRTTLIVEMRTMDAENLLE